ncbi:MAG: DUF1570 domain-containing protein, partial [Planctomycetes bacterium]|nr:DUF1570 domain-containing protein [Planctomycetota bacterium]
NVQTLADARAWINAKAAEGGADGATLQALTRTADQEIRDNFQTLAASFASQDTGDAKKLRLWAEGLTSQADQGLAAALEPGLRILREDALRKNPDDADLRRQLGWVELNVDFDAMRAMPWMVADEDAEAIDDLETKVSKIAKKIGTTRWLPPSTSAASDLAQLEARIAERKAAYEERMMDPFEQAAAKVADLARDDLKKNFSQSYQWISYTHKPYVFLIEKDLAWDESKVGEQKAEMLEQLYDLFYREYRELLGLQDITDPVPVICFKKHKAYAQYAAKTGLGSGAVGHFEHTSGRLFVSDETERDTLFHEGTHQLIAYNTRGRMMADFLSRSYWFQEGVAEYFGATSVSIDPDTKAWKYEMGLLQEGRLSYWRQNEAKAYSLWDLLAITYRTREENKGAGDEDFNLFAYSQGWFLIYFLNNFAVDAEGMVQLKPTKSKYHDGWRKYFQGELQGKTGRDFFLECMGLMGADGQRDEAKWAAFEKDFNAYYEWMNYKTSLKYHVKDRRMIPWDQVQNIREKKIGEKDNDMLYRSSDH